MSWHHAPSWPGTYSDDCVKQVTTGTQTSGIVAQRWIAPLHGRRRDRLHLGNSNPRTVVAFPGPRPSTLTPVARDGCSRGLTKVACREQLDVYAMTFSQGY